MVQDVEQMGFSCEKGFEKGLNSSCILMPQIKTRCEKGIPARVRGQAWKLITKSTLEQFPLRKMTDYKVRLADNVLTMQELLLEECEHSAQITKDINRTFPKNILLMQKGG